jgi:hypothetical protein
MKETKPIFVEYDDTNIHHTQSVFSVENLSYNSKWTNWTLRCYLPLSFIHKTYNILNISN